MVVAHRRPFGDHHLVADLDVELGGGRPNLFAACVDLDVGVTGGIHRLANRSG